MRLKFWRRKPHPEVCDICGDPLRHEHSPREIEIQKLLDLYEDAGVLFDVDVEYLKNRRDANIIRLPSDPNVVSAWYRGIRAPRNGEARPGITYDAEKAHELLASKLLNNQGKPYETDAVGVINKPRTGAVGVINQTKEIA